MPFACRIKILKQSATYFYQPCYHWDPSCENSEQTYSIIETSFLYNNAAIITLCVQWDLEPATIFLAGHFLNYSSSVANRYADGSNRIIRVVLFCKKTIMYWHITKSSEYHFPVLFFSISWNTFYVSEKFPTEFEPPTPMVRDPANPGFNVADTLCYWGQFKSELILWMKALGVNVCNVDSWQLIDGVWSNKTVRFSDSDSVSSYSSR